MLDNTDFTQRELKIELRNAFQSKKISCDEYEKDEKKLDEDYRRNKHQLRKISIFRKFLDYKISDLYITDRYGYCDILVKIGKTFDSADLYFTYKNSYFMSLKSGNISSYPLFNNYGEHYVEPLSNYIVCDKDSISFKEAMVYFEEKVIIQLLLRRITASSHPGELEYCLDNLKREIGNIKYSKDSKIKNREQIEYCACCKLIEVSKKILDLYYNKIINRKDNEEWHLEVCIRVIKVEIRSFEKLKRFIAENDEILKEKLLLLVHNDFIECLDLINTISVNLQYIEECGNPKEVIPTLKPTI